MNNLEYPSLMKYCESLRKVAKFTRRYEQNSMLRNQECVAKFCNKFVNEGFCMAKGPFLFYVAKSHYEYVAKSCNKFVNEG